MEVWIVKLLGATSLLICALLFGYMPFIIVKCTGMYTNSVGIAPNTTERRGRLSLTQRAKSLISYLNAFAGGVFLGSSLLHLLPEVRESTVLVMKAYNLPLHYPVAELLTGIGLFLVMLVENAAMGLGHRRYRGQVEDTTESPLSNDYNAAGLPEPTVKISGCHRTNRSSGACFTSVDLSEEKIPILGPQAAIAPPKYYGSGASQICDKPHDSCNLSRDVQIEPLMNEVDDTQLQSTNSSVTEADHDNLWNNVHGIRAVVLLLSLSLHTLFEGLALGLQSKTSEIVSLLAAITVHKSVISFSMGLQFLENIRSRSRAILFIVLFAIMAPCGILIGLFLTRVTSNVLNVINATLQGLATGTFLYVTFFEVLFREFGNKHSTMKVIVVILGFACMGTVQIFHEEHD